VIGQYSPQHSDWRVQCGTEDTDFFGTGVAVWTTNRIEIFLKEQAKSLESQEEWTSKGEGVIPMEQLRSYAVERLVGRMRSQWPRYRNTRSSGLRRSWFPGLSPLSYDGVASLAAPFLVRDRHFSEYATTQPSGSYLGKNFANGNRDFRA